MGRQVVALVHFQPGWLAKEGQKVTDQSADINKPRASAHTMSVRKEIQKALGSGSETKKSEPGRV
jgi:hypothetical protein